MSKLSTEELIQRLARAAHLQDDETGEVAWTCRYAIAHIAALERELGQAKHARGSFPEERAYMALLRLPITGALRATPELQAAMATCVVWLSSYIGQSRQYVQEYYEDRIAAEVERLSPSPSELAGDETQYGVNPLMEEVKREQVRNAERERALREQEGEKPE